MITSLVFCLVTVPGNLLVVLVVLIDPNKNFRTPFTLLILNLAMSDLIVGIISEPLSVWTHYREAMGWSLPMRWLSQTAFFLCCTASLLSLAVLTSDRYLAIAYPIWYRSNVSFKRVGIASFFIWVLSAAFTSIYYYIGFVAYAFIFANIAVFCTIFIVIFAYTRIFYVIRDYVDNQANLHANASALHRTHIRVQCWETKIIKTYKVNEARFHNVRDVSRFTIRDFLIRVL
ncbi:predicted protein [Nematostella vectensis]|uniref:G-protein coupled receptors family 1 profile domain-containing protein n=1 Tax=Nematostella vectensis TaxID=45351 RepID=A7RK96_NEMVE|nr:predicted protein [Nematostella vectensis]|eukprot:XP_001640271.1 predicted protein [Nematostella vectensis]